jgi:hypothetical protein
LRLFLDGTLLDDATLRARGGDARLAARRVPATLPGWRRVVLRGTRYPTLRRHGTGCVAGSLLHVSASVLSRLATYYYCVIRQLI